MGGRRARLLAGVVLLAVLAGCADEGGDDAADSAGTGDAVTTTSAAAAPAADVDLSSLELRPIDEGAGVPQAGDEDLPAGYVESEYLLSGVAGTYEGPPNQPARPTGEELEFTTRLLVRAPEDPADYSGRAFVEPFNTSGGADADVVWRQVEPVLADAGDVWVGVTVRHNSGVLAHEVDPERYAAVDVPVNDVAWDVLRQVGGLLKEGHDQSPVPGTPMAHVYMGGYSQSGLETATFLSAIAGATRMEDGSPVYDGYLPAARSASLTPLQSGTAFVPTFVYEPMGPADVPVVDLETQSDVQGFSADALGEVYTSPGGAGVRRDDSDAPDDLHRLYEVAGMPHGSGGSSNSSCDGPPSQFPNLYFVRAAVEQLFAWAETGEPAPEAARLEMTPAGDGVFEPEVDAVGNALGGVRSPYVDVPLATFDAQSDPGALCKLRGRQVPLDPATLDRRYDGAEDHLAQFTESLDATIAAGFLREADRQELLALAEDAAAATFPPP